MKTLVLEGLKSISEMRVDKVWGICCCWERLSWGVRVALLIDNFEVIMLSALIIAHQTQTYKISLISIFILFPGLH